MYLTQQERRKMAGEVLLCGFEGTQVGPELKEIMREVQPLGLILFGRNVGAPEANMELCRELKSLRKDAPVLLSVDQEGGRVARLKTGMSLWPPMATLGKMHAVDAPTALTTAREVGAALGNEVRAQGFDVDFAPVLDVHTNPQNPVIGDRAFSEDANVAAALTAPFVQGLQGTGVAACGKHFPGHGDTLEDSHLSLPRVSHDLRRLQEVEWRPFVAAIAAGLSSIMTAHMVVEPLDDKPATLSHTFLTQHLRGTLGFGGVIISDDVDMKALSAHYDMEAVGPMGLLAGIDLFLACRDPDAIMRLYRGIILAAETGALPHEILADRAKRATAWRTRYQRPAPGAKAGTDALARLVDAHRPLVDRLGSFA
jgi:beta-N-acetylhexosaminidase